LQLSENLARRNLLSFMTGTLLNEVRVFQRMTQMLEDMTRKIKLLTMEDTLQADKGFFQIIILNVILITGYQNKRKISGICKSN
jgi:hypothetical protein